MIKSYFSSCNRLPSRLVFHLEFKYFIKEPVKKVARYNRNVYIRIEIEQFIVFKWTKS